MVLREGMAFNSRIDDVYCPRTSEAQRRRYQACVSRNNRTSCCYALPTEPFKQFMI